MKRHHTQGDACRTEAPTAKGGGGPTAEGAQIVRPTSESCQWSPELERVGPGTKGSEGRSGRWAGSDLEDPSLEDRPHLGVLREVARKRQDQTWWVGGDGNRD